MRCGVSKFCLEIISHHKKWLFSFFNKQLKKVLQLEKLKTSRIFFAVV